MAASSHSADAAADVDPQQLLPRLEEVLGVIAHRIQTVLGEDASPYPNLNEPGWTLQSLCDAVLSNVDLMGAKVSEARSAVPVEDWRTYRTGQNWDLLSAKFLVFHSYTELHAEALDAVARIPSVAPQIQAGCLDVDTWVNMRVKHRVSMGLSLASGTGGNYLKPAPPDTHFATAFPVADSSGQRTGARQVSVFIHPDGSTEARAPEAGPPPVGAAPATAPAPEPPGLGGFLHSAPDVDPAPSPPPGLGGLLHGGDDLASAIVVAEASADEALARDADMEVAAATPVPMDDESVKAESISQLTTPHASHFDPPQQHYIPQASQEDIDMFGLPQLSNVAAARERAGEDGTNFAGDADSEGSDFDIGFSCLPSRQQRLDRMIEADKERQRQEQARAAVARALPPRPVEAPKPSAHQGPAPDLRTAAGLNLEAPRARVPLPQPPAGSAGGTGGPAAAVAPSQAPRPTATPPAAPAPPPPPTSERRAAPGDAAGGNRIQAAGAEAEAFDLEGDAALGKDAQHIHAAPSGMTIDEEDANAYLVALFERLNRIGLDGYKQNFPNSEQHDDYMENHRDIAKFWGIKLTTHSSVGDVKERYRRAALLMHPDKHEAAGPVVKEHLTKFMAILNDALAEVKKRIQLIQSHKIQADNVYSKFYCPYQEIDERLQEYLLTHFGTDDPHLTRAVFSTSEGMAWSVPPTRGQGPAPDAAAEWLDRFLRIQSGSKGRVFWGLLQELWDGDDPPEHSRVLIVIQKHDTHWYPNFEKELAAIRAWNVTLEVVLCVMADAFPAPWSAVNIFWSDRLLDERNLIAFRTQTLYLNPAFMAVVTAGSGQLRVLKRMAVTVLSTGDAPLDREWKGWVTEEACWREAALDGFMEMPKLLIDYRLNDSAAAETLAHAICHEFDAEFLPYSSRSLADTREIKRRSRAVLFDVQPSQDMADRISEFIARTVDEWDIRACVGWEDTYCMKPGTYVLDVDSMSPFTFREVYEWLNDVVPTSKRQVLATLNTNFDASRMAYVLQEYVENHPRLPHFVRLEDYTARVIWQRPVRAVVDQQAWRARDAPEENHCDIFLSLRGCPPTRFERMAQLFIERSVVKLRAADIDFPRTMPFMLHWHRGPHGASQGKVMLHGATEEVSRVWYFAFRGYVWESQGNMQTLTVELSCAHFDEELTFAHIRRMALRRTLTLGESLRVQNDTRMLAGLARHGLTAPPPPPPSTAPGAPPPAAASSHTPALTNFADAGPAIGPQTGAGSPAQ